MISDRAIADRKILYTWCYANATWSRHQALVIGDLKAQCHAEEHMVLLDWAIDVLCKYPVGDQECTSQRASTQDDVCCAVRLADPCCASDACDSGPVPPSCDPVISATVIRVADVNEMVTIQGDGPADGDAYLIATDSGGMGWVINTIQTWNGTDWTSSIVIDGRVVRTMDTPPQLWVTLGGTNEPGLLYPPVIATWVGPPNLYIIQSTHPQVSAHQNRQARVEILGPTGWVTAYIGDESTLAEPQPFNIAGLYMDQIRTTYVSGHCSWTSETGPIEPPGCTFPRDHDCLDHDTSDHS